VGALFIQWLQYVNSVVSASQYCAHEMSADFDQSVMLSSAHQLYAVMCWLNC